MTKGELRKMIQEVLYEELRTGTYLTEAVAPAEDLIATHVVEHPEFESACFSGDVAKVLEIFDSEVKKNNLDTPGSQKLRKEILYDARGKMKVPAKVGEKIFFHIWYAQASGTGFATKNKPKY